MKGIQAKNDTAEALYNAIREEIARVNQYPDQARVLETLAHAYSMVAGVEHPEPGKEVLKKVIGRS